MRNLIILTIIIFCSKSSTAQVPSWVPANGLVAWYPFNGNADDESGNNNHCTVVSATLAPDRFNNANSAYSFDGFGSYLEAADAPSLHVRHITLAAWIKPATSGTMTVFNKGRVSDAWYEAYFMNTDFQFGFKYNSSCSSPIPDWRRYTMSPPAVGDWQFMAATYDGHNIHGYLDGNLIFSDTLTGIIDSCAGGNLRMGYCWYDFKYAFSGLMDDMTVYNRALTYCEINQLYTRGQGSISAQTQAQTVTVGQTAVFHVTAPTTGYNYAWQEDAGNGFVDLVDNSTYSGVTTPTLTITNAGLAMNGNQYRCKVSNEPGDCHDTSDKAPLFVFPLSIANTGADDGLEVYPNPANELLQITARPSLQGRSFTLANQLGQQVRSGTINNKTTTLYIKDLQPGIYYLRMEGHAQIVKLVKD